MANFKSPDRLTPMLFPPAINDWVKEGHMARFVVELVSQLDLSAIENKYRGSGSEAYHPSMMLSLLFYGYVTGIFSSRKLAQATYDLIPMRFICGDMHPDHDTIATFRKNYLNEIKDVFKQILVIAHEMKILKMGTISLDGTKIKANASKHKALSWEYANKLEQQVKDEIDNLIKMAEDSDANEKAPELNIPEELKRREDRLAKIVQAKQEIQARAKKRIDEEKKEYDKKMQARQDYENTTGKKPKGKIPKPPKEDPEPHDQVNLTDEESRIMPTANGFEQAYNAQAAVDVDSRLIVENHLSLNSNDKKEIAPALKNVQQLPVVIERPKNITADAGYFSEINVNLCETHNINPYIAQKREHHNSFLAQKLDPKHIGIEPAESESALAKMRYRLQTDEGKKLYAKRKSTIEPTFGITKQVMGFRQFLLRGAEKVSGEWNLVCTAFNIKRLHKLCPMLVNS